MKNLHKKIVILGIIIVSVIIFNLVLPNNVLSSAQTMEYPTIANPETTNTINNSNGIMNIILAVSRIFVFLVVALSMLVGGLSLVGMPIVWFTKRNWFKKVAILFGCCILAFFGSLFFYMIIGLISGMVSGGI